MNTLTIKGGTPLYGELTVSGSKNAVLPILAAAILTNDDVIIHNAPIISDIDDMLCIMKDLGVQAFREKNTLIVNSSGISGYKISNDHVGKIRSSVMLMGAVLARFRKAILAQPGGCDIGARPIDIHLSALRQMGVSTQYKDNCWQCEASQLHSAHIILPFPSVGATENVLLAACGAQGETIIENAAKEPEIVALQNIINLMGGKIRGAGSSRIIVEGCKKYHGCEYTVIPDRIVAGTYVLAVAAAGGDVTLKNTDASHNQALLDCIQSTGVQAEIYTNSMRIRKTQRLRPISYTETAPFPGFPTDLQPQLMAAMTLSSGTSVITENIYENRFKAASSLCSLGANIRIQLVDPHKSIAVIKGVDSLCGTTVCGTDLRCNAALLIAGLAAYGTTVINHAHYIERGYEDIVGAIKSIGGSISSD